ncbi:hypothetical protein IKX64_02530 [Candidatus Saccharibacteria bacterium]|nr:hypothetical protein [Candidatus Saccharibacteria bacterium]MBR5647430.1 hypothetical protein [Candidatus Saccharibacteria bacterium]
MAQAKKKTATRTAKKTTAKKACGKKCAYKSLSGTEKFHACFILAMALIAGILLAANVAIMVA